MIAIRRRWPVLTAIGATLFYVLNNYQLSGLEQVKLQPIQRTASSLSSSSNASSGQLHSNPGLGFDFTQFGIRTAPPLSNPNGFERLGPTANNFHIDLHGTSSDTNEPGWNNLLSAGEKLALWQQKMVSGPATARTNSDLGSTSPGLLPLPGSTPIPVPAGLMPIGGGRPSTTQGNSPSPFPLPVDSAGSARDSAGDSRIGEAIVPGARMTGLAPSANAKQADVPRLTAEVASQPPSGKTIRIASFNIPGLGPAILSKPHALQIIVSILREYDLVALQGIQTDRDDVLPLIVDRLNQSGRNYDYMIGPRVGRVPPHSQFAFIFDTSRLETDRYQLYTVDDPEDLMNLEPLVAWFRCLGVPPQDAFTFSIANISINPSFADAERAHLPKLIQAIEKDGRYEDDWLLVGDFAGGRQQLSMLSTAGVRFAISDIPTDVTGTQMLSSVLFSARATTEFTGRAGAYDFLRKYNLSLEQALEISNHMPVWAEFSIVEGDQLGRVAPYSSVSGPEPSDRLGRQ